LELKGAHENLEKLQRMMSIVDTRLRTKR
jgi:hypothetical protein